MMMVMAAMSAFMMVSTVPALMVVVMFMTFPMMSAVMSLAVMMVTGCLTNLCKCSCNKCLYRLVSLTAAARVKSDSCFRQCHLCTAADTAANECINLCLL